MSVIQDSLNKIAEVDAKITEHQTAIAELVEERKEAEANLGIKGKSFGVKEIVELIDQVVEEKMSNAVVSSEMEA